MSVQEFAGTKFDGTEFDLTEVRIAAEAMLQAISHAMNDEEDFTNWTHGDMEFIARVVIDAIDRLRGTVSTVHELAVLNLPPMSDDSNWVNADDLGSKIKQVIQGVAIYSDMATHFKDKHEDDDDENDLIARKYYDLRNDAMRDVHRLVDALSSKAA